MNVPTNGDQAIHHAQKKNIQSGVQVPAAGPSVARLIGRKLAT